MSNAITFANPTVFISASQDMQAEADICCQVVAELARDYQGDGKLEVFKWNYADHTWTSGETCQNQIPRVSVPQVKAVICLFGERLGWPLPAPPDFCVPEEILLPDVVAHPWPEDGIPGKIPLTGTGFEFLDALLQKAPTGEHLGDRLLVYVKCDATLFGQKGLDAEERELGFEQYKDVLIQEKKFKRKDQEQYYTQLEWLEIFYETHFRKPARFPLFFGEQDRENSLRQLRDKLRKDLARVLGVKKRTRRADPKGLLAYQPEDWDILFGRDRAIDSLMRQLNTHATETNGTAIILLTGLSGQGKSSLLRAGIIGRIKHGGQYQAYGNFLPVLVDASLLQQEDPVLFLAQSIEEQSGLPVFSQKPPLTDLSPDSRSTELIRRTQAALADTGQKLLLAVDQAEQLLFLEQDEHSPSPRELLDVLTALARKELAWCVLTIPVEQEQALARLLQVEEEQLAPSFRLGPPDDEDLDLIIRNAFKLAKVPAQEEQIRDIKQQALAWLSDQATPGAVLPLLSLLLSELVQAERERRKKERLKNDDEPPVPVPTLGSVLDRLGERTWETYQKIQPVEWMATNDFERLMQQLVSTDFSGEEPEIVLRNCRCEHPAANEATMLVRVLQQHRLLFSPRPEELRLAHMAIVTRWQRCQKWYEQDKAHQKVLNSVRYDAEDWEKLPADQQKMMQTKHQARIDAIEAMWVSRRSDGASLPLPFMRACLLTFFDPAHNPDSVLTAKRQSRITEFLWINDPQLVQHAREKIDALDTKTRHTILNYPNPEFKSTPLFAAAGYGTKEQVRWLLANGANPNHIKEDTQRPLHNAAHTGNVPTAQALLAAGAKLEMKSDEWSPLMTACRTGHMQFAAFLLLQGADVTYTDSEGWTALMLAAQNGHEDVVHLLIEHNADVAQADTDGGTALMLAAQNGHEDVVHLLILSTTRTWLKRIRTAGRR